jgi:hypothetical protein
MVAEASASIKSPENIVAEASATFIHTNTDALASASLILLQILSIPIL